ncbi:hypothetical protein [Kribbella sp. CA-293567]|uniref:hypothetical protein n=1 Tax=Kribbella sp. CA-293567 TaxID=3002436 RepID=UPI0022DD3372|nr:hypothetical protein [Kribbella sp. CA-293567]WBQ06410.1 hypothetical protein OX958_06370 [Kribbella sp. CA-293567]
MQDDQEIGAELHRLAAADPLTTIDAAGLLERGRRGRRRRRVLSVTGVTAGVAAIALGAGLLPGAGLGATGRKPEVASSTSAEALFTPLPGVPRGEGALGKVTEKEALRRCAIRYGVQRLAKFHPEVYRSTMTISGVFSGPPGARKMTPGCLVPGDSRPSAAAIAKVKADPLPRSTDGQLLACSVQLWHDLTKWRVVATASIDSTAVKLLIVSPSGRSAADCELSTSRSRVFGSGSSAKIFTTEHPNANSLGNIVSFGSGTRCPSAPCAGWVAVNAGRIDPKMTRVLITAVNGRTHELTITNGWFSILWANGDLQARMDARVTGFDAAGNIVKTVKVRR